MTFLSVTLGTMEHDSPISLENHHTGKTTFNLQDSSLHMVLNNHVLIFYKSDLQHGRQICAITKTFDFASLALSNTNAFHSLQFLENQDQLHKLHDFHLYHDKEYHISKEKMSASSCPIYCARHNAHMLKSVESFSTLSHEFQFDSVWVQTLTSTLEANGIIRYRIHFGQRQIYPHNILSPKYERFIFHFHKGHKQQIFALEQEFTYYNSITRTYWTQAPYALDTAIGKNGTLFIYVPENPVHLLTGAYFTHCACTREPTVSARLFRELRNNFQTLKLQQKYNKITIEEQRLDTNNPDSGLLSSIVHPFLAPDMSNVKRGLPNTKFHTIMDLNPLFPQVIDKQNLASQFVFYTMKNVGQPMIMSLLKPKLKSLAKKLGARLFDKLHPEKIYNHTVVETNLKFHNTNYSLVLDFQNVNMYARNITSNIEITNDLVKQLTLANSAFTSFLHHHVDNILLGMAQASIDKNIDHTAPILGVVHRHDSFISIDFYITTFTAQQTVTYYKAISLPMMMKQNALQTVNIPTHFSAKMDDVGYYISNHHDDKTSMDTCINSFLGQNSDQTEHLCQMTSFSSQKLIAMMTIDSTVLYYATQIGATLKIACPNTEQVVRTLDYDVLIFIAPIHCDVTLLTTHGVIRKAANDTLLRNNDFDDIHFLVQYNFEKVFNTDDYQTITIAILSVIVFIFLAVVFGISFYVFRNRIMARIDSEISVHSITTVRPLENQSSPH